MTDTTDLARLADLADQLTAALAEVRTAQAGITPAAAVTPDGMPAYVAAGELIESAWGNAVVDALYDNLPYVLPNVAVAAGNVSGYVQVGTITLPPSDVRRLWQLFWLMGVSGHSANGTIDQRLVNTAGTPVGVAPAFSYLNTLPASNLAIFQLDVPAGPGTTELRLYVNQSTAGGNTNLGGGIYGVGYAARTPP